MNYYLKRTLSLTFGLSIIVAMLLSSVQAVVFNHSFYTSLYEKIDLAQRENISKEDLEDSIFMMTDYVEGKRDDLDGHIYWHNHTQPTFNTKEIRHMKDVRDLWLKAQLVMRIAWVLALVSVITLALLEKKQCLADLALGFKDGLICFAVLLVFFGFWWLIDFTGFWTWFHTIVFPGNSDWLLNPATDFMIVICPEEMFSTMVFQIAARLVGSLAVVGLVLRYFYHHSDDQKDIEKLKG
ncbi:MAG: TIGR01906 family membrane protein [Allobaculum sp.]